VKEEGLVVEKGEVMQRPLRVSCRQRKGARRRTGLPVLLRERERRLAIQGDAGGERHADGRARRQPDALPQTEDWIEHDASGTRQSSPVERRRIASVPALPEKLRAVGFPFDRPLGPALEAEHVDRPEWRVGVRTGTAMTEQRR